MERNERTKNGLATSPANKNDPRESVRESGKSHQVFCRGDPDRFLQPPQNPILIELGFLGFFLTTEFPHMVYGGVCFFQSVFDGSLSQNFPWCDMYHRTQRYSTVDVDLVSLPTGENYPPVKTNSLPPENCRDSKMIHFLLKWCFFFQGKFVKFSGGCILVYCLKFIFFQRFPHKSWGYIPQNVGGAGSRSQSPCCL